jgi:glycine/D-amino acid oxidase-like deaminating enzyme
MTGDLPSRARVVAIGAGIVGCSTAYHLTRLGWRDVVLLAEAGRDLGLRDAGYYVRIRAPRDRAGGGAAPRAGAPVGAVRPARNPVAIMMEEEW